MQLRVKFRSLAFLVMGVLGQGLVGVSAQAGTVTYVTPGGATNPNDGKPVDATATFTTSTDTITVVLNNLEVNPTAVSQNISDILFTVSTGQHTGSINQGNSSGMSRKVNSGGSFTDNGIISPTHWALQTSGSQLHLNDLTGGQPKQTIIGQPGGGGYTNANSSITGSTHNPFLYGPVTFTLDVPGVTSASDITAVTFSFGTDAGENVIGIRQGSVPEPGSFALLATAGLVMPCVYAVRRHRARSKTNS